MTTITRRSVLALAGVAAAATGTGILSGCSNDAQGPGTTSNKAVTLPDYIKYEGVKPDLKGNGQGVADAMFSYPQQPPKLFEQPPLSGAKARAMTLLYDTFLPVDKNPYWQELNKRSGLDLSLTTVPSSEYSAKLATTLAGNDLPDLTFITAAGVPRLPDLLKAKFSDLAPLVSGDKIKDYPYLASLPTPSWGACVYAGGLYGVPIVRSTVDGLMFARADLIEAAGHKPEVGSLEEMTELSKALTDESKRRWAIGGFGIFWFAQAAHGVPNKWRLDKGTLTAAFEDEGYLKALQYVADLVKAGYLHPSSSDPNLNYKDLFKSGQAAMVLDGQAAWPGFLPGAPGVDEKSKVTAIIPPGMDGKDPSIPKTRGIGGMTVFKKADDDRLKELLTYCNFLASPFGTEEYRFLNFGIENEHWKPGPEGDPTPLPNVIQYTGVTRAYIADCERPLYVPGQKEAVEAWHAALMGSAKYGVADPTVGLTSATDTAQGEIEGKKRSDLHLDIFMGRKPVSAFSEYVKTWSKGVGAKTKEEYLAAIEERDGTPR